MIGGGCGPVGAAHEWRTADPSATLGMTNKERVVARKGRLLNRGIFQT
jgi:hypothetical protein